MPTEDIYVCDHPGEDIYVCDHPGEDVYVCDHPTNAPSENQWTCDPIWIDQFDKMFDILPPQANENGEAWAGYKWENVENAGCEGENGEGQNMWGCNKGGSMAGNGNEQCYGENGVGQCYGENGDGQYYNNATKEQPLYEGNGDTNEYGQCYNNNEEQLNDNTYSTYTTEEVPNTQLTSYQVPQTDDFFTLQDQQFTSATPCSQYPDTECTLSTTTPCSSIYDSHYQTTDHLNSDSTLYNTDQCIHTYNVINTVENV